MQAAKTAPQPQSAGDRIQRLFALKREKAQLNQQVKAIDEELADLERAFIAELQAQGLERMTTQAGTLSLGNKLCVSAEDWDEFYEYIKSNDYFHLLHRRISATAVEELLSAGVEVPGLSAHYTPTLSTRQR